MESRIESDLFLRVRTPSLFAHLAPQPSLGSSGFCDVSGSDFGTFFRTSPPRAQGSTADPPMSHWGVASRVGGAKGKRNQACEEDRLSAESLSVKVFWATSALDRDKTKHLRNCRWFHRELVNLKLGIRAKSSINTNPRGGMTSKLRRREAEQFQ